MKNILHFDILHFALIIILLLGIILGWAVTSLLKLDFSSLFNRITYIGSLPIGNYQITFVKECRNANGLDCDGLSQENENKIIIKSGLSVERTIRVCNHEMCHILLNEERNVEEFLCTNVEKTLNHPVCQTLRQLVS